VGFALPEWEVVAEQVRHVPCQAAKSAVEGNNNMQQDDTDNWRHSHRFGQDRKRLGEIRTIIVILIYSLPIAIFGL